MIAATAEQIAEARAAGYGWLDRNVPNLSGLGDVRGLFTRGDLKALDAPRVAIVGARACTDYGAHVARTLARDLAAEGVTVVSGLARGIDAWAHRGALEAGGRTIAVLGCGIDRDYPRANMQIAAEIVDSGGLILSEYGLGVPPAPWQFPARNRIVARLSAVTVVVEARERSGSLITAALAREAGRIVAAVPGEITSAASRGSNQLLRDGAQVVLEAGDVLDLIKAGEIMALISPTLGDRDPEALAARLADAYGPDPSLVGSVDGTEDDFGDLISDAYEALGGDDEDDELWGRFQDAAGASEATTMVAWLEELAVVVDEP